LQAFHYFRFPGTLLLIVGLFLCWSGIPWVYYLTTVIPLSLDGPLMGFTIHVAFGNRLPMRPDHQRTWSAGLWLTPPMITISPSRFHPYAYPGDRLERFYEWDGSILQILFPSLPTSHAHVGNFHFL